MLSFRTLGGLPGPTAGKAMAEHVDSTTVYADARAFPSARAARNDRA